LRKLALARFSNNGGFVDHGGNLYESSIASGTAFIGTGGQGGLGT
jgi:flagellar hook protein FlgE